MDTTAAHVYYRPADSLRVDTRAGLHRVLRRALGEVEDAHLGDGVDREAGALGGGGDRPGSGPS